MDPLLNPILKELDTAGLKERLKSYPYKLLQARQKANSLRAAQQDTYRELKAVEAILMSEIAQELTPQGKAKFSNAEARVAEFAIRSKSDFEYQQAFQANRQASEVLEAAEAEMESIQNRWLGLQKVSDLVVAELYVLANCLDNVAASQ